jgi:glycosyltransferase involved in cell wall biosynthesis
MKTKKLLLIGPLPPPAGGVSIHIWRLAHLLIDDINIDFIDESNVIKPQYFNLRTYALFPYLKKIRKADLLFIHSGSNLVRYIHLITGKIFSRKMILTLHCYPFRKNFILKYIDECFYRLADKVIVVNADILERIKLPAVKTLIKHAFLPPVMTEEPELPYAILEKLDADKKAGKLILCSNAWRLDIYNNQDLYGVDLCIEVTKMLVEKGVPVSFVFNISTIDQFQVQYDNYQKMIRHLNLENNFILINERLSFVRIMEKSDIVLRPTNTDGDSLTIREALYLGKPILASDIVQRPDGTVLFKSRDILDLEKKLLLIIQDLAVHNKVSKCKDDHSYKEFYTALIQSLIVEVRKNFISLAKPTSK